MEFYKVQVKEHGLWVDYPVSLGTNEKLTASRAARLARQLKESGFEVQIKEEYLN